MPYYCSLLGTSKYRTESRHSVVHLSNREHGIICQLLGANYCENKPKLVGQSENGSRKQPCSLFTKSCRIIESRDHVEYQYLILRPWCVIHYIPTTKVVIAYRWETRDSPFAHVFCSCSYKQDTNNPFSNGVCSLGDHRMTPGWQNLVHSCFP